jgi:2-polyprenyl-3-methyl-5-hydroxy-6-metoxy-1,4-benzoquinol methylase
MMSAQEKNIRVYREYYSNFARAYERRTKQRAKIIAETMRRWVRLDGLKILDFGVGTGMIWEELYRKGVQNIYVVGLDVAHGILEVAKERKIPWLNVIEQRVEDWNYKACFDLVCAHSLLKHCEDPMIIARKAHEALRRDGLFFVDDLSIDDVVLRIIEKFSNKAKRYLKPSGRRTSFYLPDDELVKAIRNAGFSLQNIQEYTYKSVYDSLDQIKNIFLEETMFGLYTYRSIPTQYRQTCDKTFHKIIQDEIKEPTLERHFVMSLFQKI